MISPYNVVSVARFFLIGKVFFDRQGFFAEREMLHRKVGGHMLSDRDGEYH